MKAYAAWALEGVVYSTIAFFFAFHVFRGAILREDGRNSDLWAFSVTTFTSIILMVTQKLMLYQRLFNAFHLVSVTFLSVGAYFGYVWFSNYM